MKSYTSALVMALVPVFICLMMIVDILSGATSDDPLIAYLELGNLGLGLLIGLLMRFRTSGMGWALIAMAVGQLVIAGVALLVGIGTPAVVLTVSGIIALFFSGAAWMFWRTATEETGGAG